MKNGLFLFLLATLAIALSYSKTALSAPCPSKESYAILTYGHQLLNQYITSGTYSQAQSLSGGVGISISPQGVNNAGNNRVNRTIDLVYTTANCDCLSDTAASLVTVTVQGSCTNGALNMSISENYQQSSAVVTCTGDDSCATYTQPFPASSNNYSLSISYANGARVTKPYQCSNCSGMYSWVLTFTDKPPETGDTGPVPIAPMLPLMLKRAAE